jgi:hypothetical protein
MDLAAIQEALHKQPFLPFTFRLADGRALTVPHPDFVAISPRRVIVINPQDESHSVLEPLLIVSIEYPASAKPSEN